MGGKEVMSEAGRTLAKARSGPINWLARPVNWIARKFDISTNGVYATIWAIFAAIMINFTSSALYGFFVEQKWPPLNLLWAFILTFASLFLGVLAVAKSRLALYVRDLKEGEGAVKPHGAVVLALSMVGKSGTTASQYAGQVGDWVHAETDKTPLTLITKFSKLPAWEGHAWQAAIIALLPHIDIKGGPRVPPIFVLTSAKTDKSAGSDDEYKSFHSACTALFEDLLTGGGPIKQIAGLDFEKFNALHDKIEETLKAADALAKRAPEGITKSAIIDVTGAPRPFAIAAASLTLGTKAQTFTYVSQADGQLRHYNLYGMSEKPLGS
jgi:hypothetical protein